MLKLKNVLPAAFAGLLFLFMSCFGNWQSETGTITVNFGDGNSRSSIPWPPDAEDNDILGSIEYEISLLENDKLIKFENANGRDKIMKITVPVGEYTLKIDAFLFGEIPSLPLNDERIHYAFGSEPVNVRAGQITPVTVTMHKAFPDDEINCDTGHDFHEWIHDKIATETEPVGFEHRNCKRENCEFSETRAFDFYYSIGDDGPGSGIIIYIADGKENRPLGFTVQGFYEGAGETENLNFDTYTAYYLEAAPVNTSETIRWAENIDDLIPGLSQASNVGTDWVIGRGRLNTAIIINRGINYSTPYLTPAASICAALNTGDKTDWFLPSKDEVYLFFQRSNVTGMPATGSTFWSSSQSSNSNAWTQQISGSAATQAKNFNGRSVRAIRAF